MTTEERREQIAQMSRTIFQYCLSRTSSYQDAEDLAQEILLESCRCIENLREEKAFYAFVWRTADNILKTHYRRQKKRRECEVADSQSADMLSVDSFRELEEMAETDEQLGLIVRELKILNSNYRRAMIEYYFNGRSVKEISALFSISESMVKYLLFQSRKKIREGVNMERNYGKLSYDPVMLELSFWGNNNNYWKLFDSKLRQNIVMACYYEKMNEEQLSLQTGVPTAYLEEELKTLLEYGVLTENSGFYKSNIVIVTKKALDDISKANEKSVKETAEFIKSAVDGMMEEVRGIGFYGSDMPLNSMKWLLVSQLLHLAYVDMEQGEIKLDYPEDKFGQKCFRWLTESTASDELYRFGTSNSLTESAHICFYDVTVNGEMVHPKVSRLGANLISSLMKEQPKSENDKLLCTELMNMGILTKTENGIKPNFPCLDKAQAERFTALINPPAWTICNDAMGRIETISRSMAEHTPAHLADYAKRMPLLIQFKEVEEIMRMLCESGWLLPWTGGMLATTIMYEI